MSRSNVEAGERRWLEAMNAGDAAAVAAVYAEGARLMPPNMDVLSGRASIEAFCKEFIAMGAMLSFELLEVHEADDLCAAVGCYEMDLRPPGGEPQRDNGKYIEVWRRDADGTWRIFDDIFNSSMPSSAA